MTTMQKAKVTVFSKDYCPYCKMAKKTLKQLGLKFEEFDITFNRAYAIEMLEKSMRHTVPQIFIDDHHIGGNDDLQIALQNGELDKILQNSYGSSLVQPKI